MNRGKRSVVCDLADPAGLESAKQYANTADVVIENFKPGTMERFGLGYDEIAAANPGVVYCSISGFGDGAGAELPGYDLLVQAVGGLMSVTGASDEAGGEPTKVGVALVDVITGLNAVIGIQAALRERDVQPYPQHGQHVKVTLLGSLLAALANQAAATLETGDSPVRLGNEHPSIAPYATYRAADQPIALAVGTDGQFARLCAVLGVPQAANDERFSTNPARVANRAVLRELLEQRLADENAEVWIERFTKASVPAGRVNTISQAFVLATTLGLDPVAETVAIGDDGSVSTVRTPANPISLSRTPVRYELPPPGVGEHQGADWLPRE